MTIKEQTFLEKQKQVYFITQQIENAKGLERMAYTLTVDWFLDNGNSYNTIDSLSRGFRDKYIHLSPESLYDSLSQLKVSDLFNNFPSEEKLDQPFRLSNQLYDDLCQSNNCIDSLKNYVTTFLETNGEDPTYSNKIIGILLDSIFYCNIKFLRHIVSAKCEGALTHLINNQEQNQEDHIYSLFNQMLITSTVEFDNILRTLILRTFDFLSLNYNPNHGRYIEKSFSGKYFYLDSSFIIRLLGFDGEYRQERSIQLIDAIKTIKGVTILVHQRTLEEAKGRIKELLGKFSKIIDKNLTVIDSIFSHDEGNRDNYVYTLFKKLKNAGKVRNSNDFAMYCTALQARLTSIVPTLQIDQSKLPSKISEARKQLSMDLNERSEKTQNRIHFIAQLLDYIDLKRGANNYDISDINYWLITTDRRTVQCDNQNREVENIPDSDEQLLKKGVCIMPSELIRMIDGFSGNIKADHVGVFKNYMLRSHVFPKQYSESEVKTICKIASLVEATDLAKYDIDEMVNNVLNKTSIKEIQKRIDRFKIQKEKDEAIVDLFRERNEDYIETKYSATMRRAERKATKEAENRCTIIKWVVLLGYIVIMLWLIIDRDNFNLMDITTYFKDDVKDSIEVIIGLIMTFPISKILDKMKKKYIRYYVNKECALLTED